ncbi:type II restriction endonuclease subunit M [Chitinophagaceae bacterium IBVUCB2]|nr:type II restriction endonuclease subunit M [Chitinophagaceae bacterium IBVUCB2]
MAVLTPQQRNTLESAVKQARKMAEAGAFNALHGLAVDSNAPFPHMTSEERNLRNSLWAKAKLLGDKLDEKNERKIEHLTYELAYETWHKMLFAKFLEANGLLIHPDGVGVTMEDCEELCKEEGFVDKWDAAANYASKMLPAIFRTGDPLMQVVYATDERIKLEEIIDALENQIFIAEDALGWVYQFWQSEAKAAINASGDKIDGEKLPAVTQLFTEPYMVHFLIDNTLGAWWVNRNPGVKPPVKFEYLRLLEDGKPAAGKFEGWPDKTAGVTALDPCMGSGHFVASLFGVFAALRMHEEGLTKEQATDKVIAENLHGLELDARCTQIAAFNLALTAWKFCGHYKELPEMNLACSGIAPKGKVEDWVKLVGKVERADDKLRLENGMKMLYQHFQLAPELGSLLDPSTIKADAFTASFDQLQPVLKKALENEADTEQLERGVVAAGIAKAGQLLAKKYTLQITNVPYLGRGRQKENGELANFCTVNFPLSKGELANVFFERMLKSSQGTACSVMPQNWLFQATYKKHREDLLKKWKWNFIVKFGPGAFSQISGEVVKAILAAVSKQKPSDEDSFFGIDASKESSVALKEDAVKFNSTISLTQKSQLNNPDSKIILENYTSNSGVGLLQLNIDSYQGIKTGDDNKFKFLFWENKSSENWRLTYGGPFSLSKDGCHYILNWNNNGKDFARFQGQKAFTKTGFYLTNVGRLQGCEFYAKPFTSEITVLIPKGNIKPEVVYSYILSEDYENELRKIDQNLAISTASVGKVPFDLVRWEKVASEKYPNGIPKPYSANPTQWLFHGHPITTENPLQVALARILGYRWPAESDAEMELADEARTLIEAIKAFDYLTDDDGIFCIPSVNAEEAGADRFRSYLQQVFAGEWNNQTITQLLAKEGATSSNLEDWLRKEFFIQHCKLFQNRPFIWHIWDGRNDGFSALVNYHKLNKENLSKLIYTYLGDWIRMCEAKKKAGESGAEGLLSSAQKLKENLEAILEGEAPYDIFVRWKPLEQQPIGWEPDLNDGVRLNIRPFIEADILRKKPNIKWGVDRGKNPPGTYWGEVRDNDKHLSLKEKIASRENKT